MDAHPQHIFNVNCLMRLAVAAFAAKVELSASSLVSVSVALHIRGHLPDSLSDELQTDYDIFQMNPNPCCDMHAIAMPDWFVDAVLMLSGNPEFRFQDLRPGWERGLTEVVAKYPVTDTEVLRDSTELAKKVEWALLNKGPDHWAEVTRRMERKAACVERREAELAANEFQQALARAGMRVVVVGSVEDAAAVIKDLAACVEPKQETKH